jgi:hypothetical protein
MNSVYMDSIIYSEFRKSVFIGLYIIALYNIIIALYNIIIDL